MQEEQDTNAYNELCLKCLTELVKIIQAIQSVVLAYKNILPIRPQYVPSSIYKMRLGVSHGVMCHNQTLIFQHMYDTQWQQNGEPDVGSQLTEMLEQYWETKAFDIMASWCKSFCEKEVRNSVSKFSEEQSLKIGRVEDKFEHKIVEVKKDLMDLWSGPFGVKHQVRNFIYCVALYVHLIYQNQAIEQLESVIEEIAQTSASHKCVCHGSCIIKAIKESNKEYQQNYREEIAALQLHKKISDDRLHKLQTTMSNILVILHCTYCMILNFIVAYLPTTGSLTVQ